MRLVPIIARAKVYAQRGTTYLNLASQAMVLRLFLVSQGITSWAWFTLALSLTATALITLMYAEDRAGVFEAETELNWSRSPQLAKIIAALDISNDRAEEI